MTSAQQQRLAARVDDDLESLAKELKAFELQLRPIAPDCSLGDLLRSEMMHDQEVLSRACLEAKKRYNRLLYVKEHLHDEGYGFCADCEDAIAFERLLLMPESRYCVSCAKENNL
jgi:DnaK suppressor protein